MTNIARSHFYLKLGNALGEVMNELISLNEQHENWLPDATLEFVKNNKFGNLTINLESIQSLEQNFRTDKLQAVLFGLRELSLLFYRRKSYFDDTAYEEGHLSLAIQSALDIFAQDAEDYLEEKLDAISSDELQAFEAKLRAWSLLKARGANATNEISALLCREGATKPHPILFEMALAKEIIIQAEYQYHEIPDKLTPEEKTLLEAFISDFKSAQLDSWEV